MWHLTTDYLDFFDITCIVSLNLAVSYTMKQSSSICSEALESAYEITKLIKYSRNAQFNKFASEHEDDERSAGIRKYCPTRWTVRGTSINSVLENYNTLNELWESCLQMSLQPDVKGRIIGIQTQMSKFKLLFGLKIYFL